MSIMTKAEHTSAEKALIEGLETVAAQLPGDVGNVLLRQKAVETFAEKGLPSRKIEAWHYTDLRTLLRDIPDFVTDTACASDGEPAVLEPILAGCTVLPLINGKCINSDALANAKPVARELSSGTISLPKHFASDDVISQINTAYVSDGWSINIGDNDNDINLIEIQNIVTDGQAHTTSPVSVAAGKKAIIIERQLGDDSASFSSAINRLAVEDDAEVLWIIIRERNQHAVEFNQFNAVLQNNAKLKLYIINAGVKLLRQEINVDLCGEGSDFQLRGVNLLNGQSHTDTTMTVRHLVENTTSTEIVRNVAMDKARGVFQGMIRVSREAQKTDARMACNSLILSDQAEFDAKPELEIFADDVACGHGATVTEINHDHLFYLMARGVPAALARGLLVKAFVQELIEELEDDPLEDALKSTIDQWLIDHL